MDDRDQQHAVCLRLVNRNVSAVHENARRGAQFRTPRTHLRLFSGKFRRMQYASDELVRRANIVRRNRSPNFEKVGFCPWREPDFTHACGLFP